MVRKKGFFARLLEMFSPSESAEAIKKRRLKEIAKKISRTKKYNKWYKPTTQEISPYVAQFFYDIYKIVGSARPLLSGAVRSSVLKNVTVESSLSKKQEELLEKLSQEEIANRGTHNKMDDFVSQINRDLKLFINDFDALQAESIDENYKNLEGFIDFVLFDYYFVLRKFDPNVIENNFTYAPNFKTIRGESMIEELKDFAVILKHLSIESNWQELFKIIKIYKNIQPVHVAKWKKLLSAINDLKNSDILDDIIRHLTGDILYRTESIPFAEKVTDLYIENLKKTTKYSVEKIVKAETSQKATVLVNRIFGKNISHQMKNYSKERQEIFLKKGLKGFIYVSEMNYLKAFLIEYVKTDIRTLCDLFLIRGDWGGSSKITADYSESFHIIMDFSPKIVAFDEKISEISDLGVKFRTLISRMDRERSAGRHLNKLLNELNEEALDMLTLFTKHIIVIANNFKNIINDYDKPRRELIQNWKEIEHNSDRPIRKVLVESYKKIYDFVMLMRLFQKNNK